MTQPKPRLTLRPDGSPRLIDTHAHLHFKQFAGEVDAAIKQAEEAGVDRIITVGVDTADSRKAVELAARYENIWATVGVHPHAAAEYPQGANYLRDLAAERKVVAIGECGLDYFKSTASKAEQAVALRGQIELGLKLELPVVFHVREAFDDFFAIIRGYTGVHGVVHSFSGGEAELDQALSAGLMVALNGIMTFTKDSSQLEAAKKVPASSMILETDCPFLAPLPYRGKTNQPAYTADIAGFLAGLRGESLSEIAGYTTANAERLFGL